MRLLILLAVIYFGLRALKRMMKRQVGSQPGHTASSGGGQIDDVLVQDPQCGVYFQRQQGFPLQEGGTTHYFCSRECRDAFIAARPTRREK